MHFAGVGDILRNNYWGDFFDAANNAAQALGILAGGAFAYVKFVRGRVFYASLEPQLEAELVEVAGRKCLSIKTTIKNTGTYKLIFDEKCDAQVTVQNLDYDKLTPDFGGPELPWSDVATLKRELFVDDEGFKDLTIEMEPQETSIDTWSLVLPMTPCPAFRVRLEISARAIVFRRRSCVWTWDKEVIITEGSNDGRLSSSRQKPAP